MLIPRRNEFDVFDDFFRGDNFFSRRENSIMKTDIIEKKDKYVIEMDLPGCEKENINIELRDGYLEISAKAIKEENSKDSEKYVHKERFYGQCSRNFYLGDSIEDDIQKAVAEVLTREFETPVGLFTWAGSEERREQFQSHRVQILKKQNRCQYCGGPFYERSKPGILGLLGETIKICKDCGKEKDY